MLLWYVYWNVGICMCKAQGGGEGRGGGGGGLVPARLGGISAAENNCIEQQHHGITAACRLARFVEPSVMNCPSCSNQRNENNE